MHLHCIALCIHARTVGGGKCNVHWYASVGELHIPTCCGCSLCLHSLSRDSARWWSANNCTENGGSRGRVSTNCAAAVAGERWTVSLGVWRWLIGSWCEGVEEDKQGSWFVMRSWEVHFGWRRLSENSIHCYFIHMTNDVKGYLSLDLH